MIKIISFKKKLVSSYNIGQLTLGVRVDPVVSIVASGAATRIFTFDPSRLRPGGPWGGGVGGGGVGSRGGGLHGSRSRGQGGQGDNALSTRPVMHYQGTLYLCF